MTYSLATRGITAIEWTMLSIDTVSIMVIIGFIVLNNHHKDINIQEKDLARAKAGYKKYMVYLVHYGMAAFLVKLVLSILSYLKNRGNMSSYAMVSNVMTSLIGIFTGVIVILNRDKLDCNV